MDITREFIAEEMRLIQIEMAKAQTFMIKAETSLAIYRMLLERLDRQESIDNFGGTD